MARKRYGKISELLGGRCEFEFVRDTPPLHMERLDGYETNVVAFTTDLPSLTRWGQPVLLGPGSIVVAHTERECVGKGELLRAVDLYCRLVQELKRTVQGRESGSADPRC